MLKYWTNDVLKWVFEHTIFIIFGTINSNLLLDELGGNNVIKVFIYVHRPNPSTSVYF